MTAKLRFQTLAGALLSLLDFGAFEPGVTGAALSFRIRNQGSTGVTDLSIGAATAAWTWDGTERESQGLEVIEEKWLEVRAGGAGAWTAIGGDPSNPANVLALGPLAAGNEVDLEIRLNPPADAESAGNVAFIPFWFADGEFGT
jgi:hypothetical protein